MKKQDISFIIISLFLIFCCPNISHGESNSTSDDDYSLLVNKAPFEEIVECKLGIDEKHSLKLLRRLEYFGSSQVYFFQLDGGAPFRINHELESGETSYASIESLSALSWLAFTCEGSPERVFIYTTAPAAGRMLTSRLFRYNSYAKEWEETGTDTMKGAKYVYLNKKETIIISDNIPEDRDEPDDIYRFAKYVSGKGTLPGTMMKVLPPKDKYQVIKISEPVVLEDEIKLPLPKSIFVNGSIIGHKP